MAMIKPAELEALIDRVNVYLRDNPTCSLLDAAKVLGIKVDRVRKWKERGKIIHLTPFQARQKGIASREEAKAARRAIMAGEPVPVKPPPEKPRGRGRPPGKIRQKQQEAPSGEVASAGFAGLPEVDALIAKGRDMKISNIRALVKAHLMMNVHDSKAVSNYAAGLKALSGVQDVELEDIYETEQLMRIYAPKEDAMTAMEVIEIDKIEY